MVYVVLFFLIIILAYKLYEFGEKEDKQKQMKSSFKRDTSSLKGVENKGVENKEERSKVPQPAPTSVPKPAPNPSPSTLDDETVEFEIDLSLLSFATRIAASVNSAEDGKRKLSDSLNL